MCVVEVGRWWLGVCGWSWAVGTLSENIALSGKAYFNSLVGIK